MHLFGILSAITSALVWGSGDFAGGLAARRSTQFQAVVLASLSGVVVLFSLAFARGESVPTLRSVVWASLAGLSGAIGMVALYRGLAVGRAAIVAPTAGLVGAGLPVIVGFLLEGAPRLLQSLGIVVGMLGIWLVSRPRGSQSAGAGGGLRLGVLAGCGFGGFFVLIALVEPGQIFAPLVVAKLGATCAAMVLLVRSRERFPSPLGNPIALVAGVLDAGGNIFYLLAKQFTRLDVVGVLASMYPAATVVLSRVILDEEIAARQWLGAGLCLAGVGLIALG